MHCFSAMQTVETTKTEQNKSDDDRFDCDEMMTMAPVALVPLDRH